MGRAQCPDPHHWRKLIHHPVVGDLDLPYESFPLPPDLSTIILTYTAEPGSPSQDALGLLASWAATTDGSKQAAAADDPEQAKSIGTPD